MKQVEYLTLPMDGIKMFKISFLLVLAVCKGDNLTTVVSTTGKSTPSTTSGIAGDVPEGVWKSPDYPKPYPVGTTIYRASVPEGYKIEITIEEFDVDGAEQDYALLKAGGDIDSNDKGILFTWKVNKRNYIIANNEAVMKFVSHAPQTTHTGFVIKWKRYGLLSTTTESPTTTEALPTPPPHENKFLTVYIHGPSNAEFVKKRGEFIAMLATMAKVFCVQKQIELAENLTDNNVRIDLATQCDILWPDTDRCIEVRFSIPVVLENANATDYELTSDHLSLMWNNNSASYLELIGWKNYEIPSDTKFLFLWLGISLGVVLSFFLGLIVLRHYSYVFADQMKRRYSDADQIITPKRLSDASLWPMANQIVPPLFENENPYSYYEPDTNTTVPARSTISYNGLSNLGAEFDDYSDEEILSVSEVRKSSKDESLTKAVHNNETTL